MKAKPNKERFFSVELTSKADLRSVNMTNGSLESVLVEGTIGELVQADFTEGVIIEVVGKKGIVRVDLEEDEVTLADHRKPLQNGAKNSDASAQIQTKGIKKHEL